jgi:outer membrane protein assembly factor BamB
MNVIPAPLFTDDKIFVRNFFSKTAYTLDRNTGTLLWEIPKVLGNFAYSPNKQVVYALRENGDLLAIDENSGEESLIAEFSPGPFVYSDGVDDSGYQLSYDYQEHILVVYTGDSRQLFAFKEK